MPPHHLHHAMLLTHKKGTLSIHPDLRPAEYAIESAVAYMVEDIFECIVGDGCEGGRIVTVTKTNGVVDTLQHTT